MEREIYIVIAYVVDSNGAINPASGYPKTFDSKNYSGDIDKTFKRAQGEFSDCWGGMCKRDDRQLQSVVLMRADGVFLDRKSDGKIAEVEPSAD